MAPRKIPAKYSCQEIYDRMSNGLCIFCEDLDTPGHHDLKHKGVKIFVTESDNESIMTESDDKPIAEESYGFVTETVMQPDLFSESLEGSTSDLQVVVAAGQKEAQNKSDSEENMSLSLGNKIEHLVGKHTQKAVRVWEPGGFIAKPATQSQGIKSFCNSIQQNEAIHSAEMIPVMLHPRLNVAAERVWEPGGLLTKLDMGTGQRSVSLMVKYRCCSFNQQEQL
ncbi:hypothetical protein Bca52824_077779 [Brassica carinata]|uniref:Uncharacterized protein n=1 Tax=Brassica carinata TaxID=52824 RepID=A0A8X7PVM2_BRACI|nr:hypothetical protein Bca52824_077779 [Brassica carinata]